MLVGEELQRLYVTTLSTAPILALAKKVYDHVPTNPCGDKTAYISFGPKNGVDAGADCIDAMEITTQIDVWSKAVGFIECENIVELIRKALHEQELELSDNALAETRVEFWQVFRDKDGTVSHGVVQVTASVEIPE